MSTLYKMFLALPIMLALHVFADYHLQGILAQLKQKDWWGKQKECFPLTKYKDDYKVALACHSFEWSFVVMLPMIYTLIQNVNIGVMICYIALLITNSFLHYTIDDLKANDKSINLVNDQLLHMIQIGVTWALWSITGW